MSVLVTVWVPGDTDKFREYVSTNEDVLRELQGKARSQGCLSHRFAVGNGHVLVIDEWESAEQFQQFFEDPQIGEVMQGSGAQGEPNIAFLDPIQTADQF
ncbi:MAG: antibiotic biosynthesis monooxygenase [Solirubrobacterales bacterium]|nr:antibiotic biosynthesis monooxygenase [Solirubrobacterales bacterium]